MMDFVRRVEEVWRLPMRPVQNPQSQMEARPLGKLLDELLVDVKIRLGIQNQNEPFKKAAFGKYYECRGMVANRDNYGNLVYPII